MAKLSSLRLGSQKTYGSGFKVKGGTTSAKAVKNSTRSLGSTAALGRGIKGMTSANSGNLSRGAYGP